MADELIVREAGVDDAGSLAALRSRWSGGVTDEPGFERRMAGWLAGDGDRRTTWLAAIACKPVGMAALFEYRRMPHPGRLDSRWGYVGNVFVREEVRNRGGRLRRRR